MTVGKQDGSINLDGELGCGVVGVARKFKSNGRLGDYGAGIKGGGQGRSADTRGLDGRVTIFAGDFGGTRQNSFAANYGGGGNFEKGGAGGCGSGGGPGILAGIIESGGKTTARGGLKKDGAGFMKGGSAASGSGGGPGCGMRERRAAALGCWVVGDKGGGLAGSGASGRNQEEWLHGFLKHANGAAFGRSTFSIRLTGISFGLWRKPNLKNVSKGIIVIHLGDIAKAFSQESHASNKTKQMATAHSFTVLKKDKQMGLMTQGLVFFLLFSRPNSPLQFTCSPLFSLSKVILFLHQL